MRRKTRFVIDITEVSDIEDFKMLLEGAIDAYKYEVDLRGINSEHILSINKWLKLFNTWILTEGTRGFPGD